MKRFLSIMLFLALVVGAGTSVTNSDVAALRKLATANAATKPGDCAACHKNEKVLPAQHVATKAMSFEDCQGCHSQGSGGPGSLFGKIPGQHIHALSGVRCSQCHENARTFAPVADEQMLELPR